MLDAIQDWAAGVALAVTVGIGGWLMRLSGRVGKHDTDLAVVKTRLDDMPRLLESIRDELRGLRKDSEDGREKLYQRIDDFRKEIKADLATKQDRT